MTCWHGPGISGMDIVGLSRELLTAELECCDLWKSNELQKKHSENKVKTCQTSHAQHILECQESTLSRLEL